MEKYLYIPTPNKHLGRRKNLRLIVWHSTESSEVRGAAHNVAAGWFAKAASRVSAHITSDNGADGRYPSGIIESVYPWDTAWHCVNANSDGYGVEIVGRASQLGVNWRDPYSLQAIANACVWLRWNAHTNVIPSRWLTDTQVRKGEAGHVTHAQVARVLGGSTHTDPGAHFPFDYVMEVLGAQLSPSPVPPSSGGPRNRRLTRGMMKDPLVAEFQAWLSRTFRSYAGHLLATGNYLDQTVLVVKEFQKRAGVTGPDANGTVVGSHTWAAAGRYGWK